MQYLTTEEFADLLHCNRRLVSAYRKAGLIQAIRAGKTYIYDQEDVKAFCALAKGHDIRNINEIQALTKIQKEMNHERNCADQG